MTKTTKGHKFSFLKAYRRKYRGTSALTFMNEPTFDEYESNRWNLIIFSLIFLIGVVLTACRFESSDLDACLDNKANKDLCYNANAGSVEAQYDLGIFFGEQQDNKNAAYLSVFWLDKAARQDHIEANVILGQYYKQLGDLVRSRMYFERSADLDEPISLNELGKMFYSGTGVDVNVGIALEKFKKSAELGYGNAQMNLALMYYYGETGKQDLKEAYAWYQVASSCEPDAKDAIKAIEDEINNAELLQSAKELGDYYKTKYKCTLYHAKNI